MRFKHNVVVRGVIPELILAAMVVEDVWWDYQDGEDSLVITSAVDGYHSYGSRHYSGNALDFRTKTLPRGDVPEFADAVKEALGEDFDVVLESYMEPNEHLHVEYHPKQGRFQ